LEFVVKLFIIVIGVKVIRVEFPDEVMKCCKRSWNLGLYIHGVLWCTLEDLKTLLEDSKDPLDDIASCRVTMIEQLLGVVWTWKISLSEIFKSEYQQLTDLWSSSIHSNGTGRFDKGQAVHLTRRSQHPRGNTSHLGCRNRFRERHEIA
jgi:hypothetical protein